MEEQNWRATAGGVTGCLLSAHPICRMHWQGTGRALCSTDTLAHSSLHSEREPEAARSLHQVGFKDNRHRAAHHPHTHHSAPQCCSLRSPDN